MAAKVIVSLLGRADLSICGWNVRMDLSSGALYVVCGVGVRILVIIDVLKKDSIIKHIIFTEKKRVSKKKKLIFYLIFF